MTTDPNDVVCCCDCGTELIELVERELQPGVPWSDAPEDAVIVELLCRRCDAAR